MRTSDNVFFALKYMLRYLITNRLAEAILIRCHNKYYNLVTRINNLTLSSDTPYYLEAYNFFHKTQIQMAGLKPQSPPPGSGPAYTVRSSLTYTRRISHLGLYCKKQYDLGLYC